jgi:hypothetical protein
LRRDLRPSETALRRDVQTLDASLRTAIHTLRAELKSDLREREHRMTIRLGSMPAAILQVGAVVKLL